MFESLVHWTDVVNYVVWILEEGITGNLKPNSITLAGSWFEAGSKLVAYRFEAGRRPASNQIA